MEHITNNDDAKTNEKVKKGMTAKKKSKKAKDTIDNIDNAGEDVGTEGLIKDFKDKVSLHPNNGLTNGTSDDYASGRNASENGDTDISNTCERLAGLNNNSEELEDRLSEGIPSESLPAAEDLPASAAPKVACPGCQDESCTSPDAIVFESYRSELQMAEIMRLIQKDLSEPYSIYTYRYFIHIWPNLCFLAMHNSRCIGAIVCKLDLHRKVKRGYIAMLAVDQKYRKRKIGSHLVKQAISMMMEDEADEVVLETEITNKPALRLYENLGFVRDKRLFRYYLNGVDALRLKLWLR